MPDKDQPSSEDGPTLELPSLGSMLRRRKDKGSKKKPTEAAEPPAEEAAASDETDQPEATDDTQVVPTAGSVEDTTVEPEGVAEADATAEPEAEPTREPEPEPEAEPEPTPERQTDTEQAPAATKTSHRTTADQKAKRTSDRPKPRYPTGLQLPALSPPVAAVVTGAVVGLLAVALTYLGMRGCEAAKGTTSCGGTGLGILILIVLIAVVVGSILLRAWRVTDPTSTSFLAVCLMAVVVLLLLVDVIYSPWMILVVPVVTLATFALSRWVTSRFIEDLE